MQAWDGTNLFKTLLRWLKLRGATLRPSIRFSISRARKRLSRGRMDVLHVVEGIFNKTDYAVIGLLTLLVLAVVFTPLFRTVDSLPGRCATLGATLYFYVRWQVDVWRIPMKTGHPSDADKIEFFRMTRNAYLLFSGIVLSLFSFTVARLRGRIEELEGAGAGRKRD